MGAFKDKIIKELIDNEQYDLADVIDRIEDDVDVANYLSSGRGYYTKMYTTPDLEAMPEFRKALYSDLKTGEVDLNKEFGEDWYKNYEQIPSDQIKFVADKQGIAYDKLVKAMSEEATKKRRQDIAHEGATGMLLSAFSPRQQDAIARGEEPSNTDYALDVGQNVLYAMPWATVFKPFARLGAAGRIAQGTAGNAATPFITEAADAITYDDSNPRGSFSPADVASQTAVNVATPMLLRSLLRGAGRFVNNNKLAKYVDDFASADRQTRNDVTRELRNLQKEAMVKAENATFANNYANPPLKTRADRLLYSDKDAYKKDILNKLNDYSKELEVYKKTSIKPSTKFTDEEVKLIATDPDLQKFIYMDVNYPQLPSVADLAKEEAIKNYLTNQFGSYMYEEQSPWTRIPVAGQAINKYFKDKEESAKRKATESRILNTLRAKYGDLR